jgi:hypothetical protein
VVGTDPDGTSLVYQLVGGDTGTFSIEANGTLHLQSTLDYETRTNYSVVARAWDGGAIGAGNFVDKTIGISVANVNEGPRLVEVTQYVDPYYQWESQIQGFLPGYYYGFRFVDPEGNATISVDIDGSPLAMGNLAQTAAVEAAYIVSSPVPLNWDWFNWVPVTVTFNVRAQDSTGAYQTTQVIIEQNYAIHILPPIALDLDGNGLDLISLRQSSVAFDMDADGRVDRTGWVGSGDGLLALDRNGDGAITNGSEISFTQDLPGAQSDLEGLAAYDTNSNGYFDAGDARYGDFRVWRDANQDGISQASELDTLASHDIHAINLTRDVTGAVANSNTDANTVVATSEFVRGDGSMGSVGDVSLAYLSQRTDITIIDPPTSNSDDIDDIDRAANGATRNIGAFNAAQYGAAKVDALAAESRNRGDASDLLGAAGLVTEEDPRLAALRRRDQNWFRPRQENAADDEWLPAGNVVHTPSALHAGLDLVSRRRHQMIEAMASFAAESSASLELQPQRRIDSKTYELLTAVSLSGPRAA